MKVLILSALALVCAGSLSAQTYQELNRFELGVNGGIARTSLPKESLYKGQSTYWQSYGGIKALYTIKEYFQVGLDINATKWESTDNQVPLTGLQGQPLGTVTINGVIKNPLSDSISISFNNNRLIYEPVNYNEELDKGSFKYTFKVKEEYTPVTIRHGRLFTELIVQPGDDLSMEAVILDSALSITYTGKGSDQANFLAKHAIDMGLVDRYPSKMQAYLKADPSTFIKKVNEDELKELLYLQKNKAGLAPSFVRYLETAYRYFSYFCLYQYPLMHEVAMSNGYNFSSIPKQNYSTVKNIPAASMAFLLTVLTIVSFFTTAGFTRGLGTAFTRVLGTGFTGGGATTTFLIITSTFRSSA